MEKIKEILMPFLESRGLKLYELHFVNEFGMKILRIAVDKPGGIDVEELAEVNEFISERIDDDISSTEYMLEVCSRGAEHEISFDELDDYIDSYVFVKANKEYLGYLLENRDETIVVSVNEKGRIRKYEIKKGDISLIRLSVKF